MTDTRQQSGVIETRWVDLSHPLSEATPPFPGDPPVEITVLDATLASDDQPREHLNCSRLTACVHCGTHMDAPFHFFANGATIDQVSLSTCCGPALLINLQGCLAPHAVIDAGDLQRWRNEMKVIPRIILYTGWYGHWNQPDYFDAHPVLTRAAARLVVESGVRLIGVDFPSVDRAPYEAHLELLGNGVVIVENLTNLHQLPEGSFELLANPLAILGRDGSPVRAVARTVSGLIQ
jgi:kynurenine formamidase